MRRWVIAVLVLLSLGEIRLFDRLLYEGHPELDFVIESVDGVLHGRPVSKSWAHRLVAPTAVAVLGRAGSWERRRAVQLFGELMIAASVGALYFLVRRKGATRASALAAVVTFGLAHAMFVYKLEYPWDGIDVLLFLAFGLHAAGGRGLARAWPLVAIGALNHETIVYIPLWYLLAPLDGRGRRAWREAGAGVLTMAVLILSIAGLRQWLYVGRPNLPESVFERATPLIENHLHVVHNLEAVAVDNWTGGRVFNSVLVLAALATFAILLARRHHVRAVVWSLVVMVTVLCFGYLNETRHYLLLMAFWMTYAWPAATATSRAAPASVC